MKHLRRAFFDIESSYGLYWSFANNTYEAQLAREHTKIKLMMVSFKEPGKRPKNLSRINYPTYHDFVVAVREEMEKYDVLVAHNGKKFDLRKCNTFFAEEGLPKIPKFPRNLIDTKNEAKREFDLPSYSLKFLLKHFGIGMKLDSGGEDRWFRCMEFNEDGTPKYPKDWKDMATYCNGDVVGGEALFDLLNDGGWVKWPSHLESIYVPGEGCIRCGVEDMQSRGKNIPRAEGMVDAYCCKNCGKRNYTAVVQTWPQRLYTA